MSDYQGAGGRLATHLPLMPAAWVQLPDEALLSLTQATTLLEMCSK